MRTEQDVKGVINILNREKDYLLGHDDGTNLDNKPVTLLSRRGRRLVEVSARIAALTWVLGEDEAIQEDQDPDVKTAINLASIVLATNEEKPTGLPVGGI